MKTVVLVEDSPTQATRAVNFLKNYYQVFHADTASLALDLTARMKPDLVVTDVTMPEMDGFELCRRIKEDDSLGNIPVLMLTGLAEAEDIIWGLEAGADSYLTKPYEDQELLSRIDFVLNNEQLNSVPQGSPTPVKVSFLEKDHVVTSSRTQILGLLLSTYESAARQNKRLSKEILEQKLIVKQSLFDAKDAEHQTGFLLENWPGPVWILNQTGELLWANEQADTMGPIPAKFWGESDFKGVSLKTLRTTWENTLSYLIVGRRETE